MTEVQKRLMELMDDIEMICRELNLSYVLFGRTAILAKKAGKFIDEQYDFDIMMPLAHAAALMKYTEDNLSESRAVESWYDNPGLKQMIFRFVDKKSTLWDDVAGHYYTKPGVAVTIFVTRTQTFNGRVFGAERYVMAKNNDGGKLPYSVFQLKKMEKAFKEDPEQAAILFDEPNIKEIVHNTGGLRWGYLRSLYMSDKAMVRWLLNKNLSGGKNDGSINYYMTRGGGWHELPEDLFEDPEIITFEGRSLRNSSKYKEFMEKLYGENWDDLGIMQYAESGRIRVIDDCDLPYKEFVRAIKKRGKPLKTMMDEMTAFNVWKNRVFYEREGKVNHTFARVRRSVDRIDVWYKLRGKRKELKQAAEKKDIGKLRNILREYMGKTNFYYQQGIGFMIDDELFSYARMIWEADGKKDYGDAVYDLVPDLYKKESVEDYLRKKGAL